MSFLKRNNVMTSQPRDKTRDNRKLHTSEFGKDLYMREYRFIT